MTAEDLTGYDSKDAHFGNNNRADYCSVTVKANSHPEGAVFSECENRRPLKNADDEQPSDRAAINLLVISQNLLNPRLGNREMVLVLL